MKLRPVRTKAYPCKWTLARLEPGQNMILYDAHDYGFCLSTYLSSSPFTAAILVMSLSSQASYFSILGNSADVPVLDTRTSSRDSDCTRRPRSPFTIKPQLFRCLCTYPFLFSPVCENKFSIQCKSFSGIKLTPRGNPCEEEEKA